MRDTKSTQARVLDLVEHLGRAYRLAGQSEHPGTRRAPRRWLTEGSGRSVMHAHEVFGVGHGLEEPRVTSESYAWRTLAMAFRVTC